MLTGKASVTLFLEAEQHIKVQIKHERELISFFCSVMTQELKDLQFSSVRPSVHLSSSSLSSSLNLHHSSSALQAFLSSLSQLSFKSLSILPREPKIRRLVDICYLSFTSLKE